MNYPGLSMLAVWATAFLVYGAVSRADDGLLVHYTFDERSGRVVHDRSGNGNDGTIEGGASWVRGLPFGALSFDGKDGVVTGPSSLSFPGAGTLEVWCHPRVFGGGLISWHYNHADAPKPLSLFFDVYSYGSLLGEISDWVSRPGDEPASGSVLHWNPEWNHAKSLVVEGAGLPADVTNRWSHIVMRFDHEKVELFRNGRLIGSKPSFFSPNTAGIPMRIGLGYPQGLPHFDGMIAEVKVYGRALSDNEIAAGFAEKASVFQPDMPRVLTVVPRLQAAKRELVIDTNLADLKLPNGSTIEVQLRAGSRVLHTVKQPIVDGEAADDLVLSIQKLAVDTYKLQAVVRDASGKSLAETARRWRLPKLAGPEVHALNNLVAELADVADLPTRPLQEVSFTNPRKGWVFISCDADLNGSDTLTVTAGGAPEGAAIRLTADGPASGETMCFLPQGPGRLTIRSQGTPVIRRVTVRSIPELIFCGFPAIPKVAGYGDYNFDFLKNEVLPNVNTIVGSWNAEVFESFAMRQLPDWPNDRLEKLDMLTRWQQMGRRWLQEYPLPSLDPARSNYHWRDNPLTEEMAYDWWVTSFGFTDPQWSGVFVDEFSFGVDGPTDTWPHRDHRYRTAPYIPALRRIAADPKSKGRDLYIWGVGYDKAGTRDTQFVEAVRRAGYKLAMEEYLSEPATEQAGHDLLYHHVRAKLDHNDAGFPGLIEDMILVPGIYSTPPESNNVDPHIDYKVWMDMQMHYMANAPECFGLAGIMWYKVTYTDEESMRWMGRLFRHYAIEGNTEMLSPEYGFTYRPNHLQNADFDEELKHWAIHEAEPDGVRAVRLNTMGRYAGRMRQHHLGNNFLLMKRSASGSNTASQTIENLVPGKLYSVKMIAADYQAMAQGTEETQNLSTRLSIDDVDIVADKSFVARPEGLAIDYHRTVFRAKNSSAKLTISDWATHATPGGPAGQEIIVNFIEVQPYFE